jgi:hypothetical protein
LPSSRYPFSRSYGVNLPSSFNTVLSIASVYSTSPPVSVSGTVYELGLFPGSPRQPDQSDKIRPLSAFVTTSRPRTINLVPIDYGLRPHLRGRLTLRGLALRRNPWTFGVSVSRTHFATYVSILASGSSRSPHGSSFAGIRNAPLPRHMPSAASVHGLSPVTSSAREGLFRPVSYYAFFKGWLLLSQPPGCFGLPTSFPT